MTDDPVLPGSSARAFDSLTDARRAVMAASEEVVSLGRHLSEAVEAARPKGFAETLAKCTRAAPLTMLCIAFAAGALFAGGRRD